MGGRQALVGTSFKANLGIEFEPAIRGTVLRWPRGCARLATGAGVIERHQSTLINFYRHVQDGLKLRIEMRNDAQLFYQHRERFNQLVRRGKAHTREGAQLFYYLNRTCFNGLCRFNKGGDFNVPFGTYKTINYASDFREYATLFKRWAFSNQDIEVLEIEPRDFVYADPPYDVEFTTYSAGGFSWDDQVRTAKRLRRHRGPVVISHQATPRIVELYESLGFQLSYLDGPRRISCTGDRSSAREVLAVKP